MLAFPQHQNISDLRSTYDSFKPWNEILKNSYHPGVFGGFFPPIYICVADFFLYSLLLNFF